MPMPARLRSFTGGLPAVVAAPRPSPAAKCIVGKLHIGPCARSIPAGRLLPHCCTPACALRKKAPAAPAPPPRCRAQPCVACSSNVGASRGFDCHATQRKGARATRADSSGLSCTTACGPLHRTPGTADGERGRCGPKWSNYTCTQQYPYCNEDNGWCGNTEEHQTAQDSEEYDWCRPAQKIAAQPWGTSTAGATATPPRTTHFKTSTTTTTTTTAVTDVVTASTTATTATTATVATTTTAATTTITATARTSSYTTARLASVTPAVAMPTAAARTVAPPGTPSTAVATTMARVPATTTRTRTRTWATTRSAATAAINSANTTTADPSAAPAEAGDSGHADVVTVAVAVAVAVLVYTLVGVAGARRKRRRLRSERSGNQAVREAAQRMVRCEGSEHTSDSGNNSVDSGVELSRFQRPSGIELSSLDDRTQRTKITRVTELDGSMPAGSSQPASPPEGSSSEADAGVSNAIAASQKNASSLTDAARSLDFFTGTAGGCLVTQGAMHGAYKQEASWHHGGFSHGGFVMAHTHTPPQPQPGLGPIAGGGGYTLYPGVGSMVSGPYTQPSRRVQQPQVAVPGVAQPVDVIGHTLVVRMEMPPNCDPHTGQKHGTVLQHAGQTHGGRQTQLFAGSAPTHHVHPQGAVVPGMAFEMDPRVLQMTLGGGANANASGAADAAATLPGAPPWGGDAGLAHQALSSGGGGNYPGKRSTLDEAEGGVNMNLDALFGDLGDDLGGVPAPTPSSAGVDIAAPHPPPRTPKREHGSSPLSSASGRAGEGLFPPPPSELSDTELLDTLLDGLQSDTRPLRDSNGAPSRSGACPSRVPRSEREPFPSRVLAWRPDMRDGGFAARRGAVCMRTARGAAAGAFGGVLLHGTCVVRARAS